MRVLIFSLSYFPLIGGAEVAMKEITGRISPEEAEFDMVTLRFEKQHAAFERVGRVAVYRLGRGGGGYLDKILFVPRAALFALRRDYDLWWAMMTNMLFPVVLAQLLGKRTTYVLTLQDGDPFEHVFERARIRVVRPLLSYGFRHVYRIQAISAFLAGWARRLGYRGEVAVVPNGVALEKFENPNPKSFDPGEVVLITTSRLVEKNGVGDIVEAMKLLPPSVSLRIIGSGPLEARLKARVRKLGLEERISFAGAAKPDDIPRHLHHADIFVRPSLSEGQGLSFLEAMAAGLPVVATPVGGIPDFLVNGETGVFCEPGNAESIARAVERLIGDDVLRERVRTQALSMVRERYSWDLIAEVMKGKVFGII